MERDGCAETVDGTFRLTVLLLAPHKLHTSYSFVYLAYLVYILPSYTTAYQVVMVSSGNLQDFKTIMNVGDIYETQSLDPAKGVWLRSQSKIQRPS